MQADTPDSLSPYELLVRRGTNELQTNRAFQESAFKISQAAWDVDQDRGVIRFQSPDGIIAVAPVQILGTYNAADGTWLWAWSNPSIAPALAQQAAGMRVLGQQNSLAELTTATLTCDEAHCWDFIAAATAMNNAQGAYRGMAGDTAVFMTFGAVTLSKSN
jgi:hypothetical protein